MQIAGKTIIITGAGAGIGRAIALAFGRQGANVVCTARRLAQLEETVRLIQADGGSALAISCDVTDESQVRAMVATTVQHFGQVDILYNNAGSFAALGGVWEVDLDLWWQDVTVNLRGVMLCARAVLPAMMARGQGIIINMRGGDQIPGGTGYSCSKVAVTRLTELMAKEQAREGTGVIVIGMGPGFVHTDMTDYQIASELGQKWLPSSKQAVDEGRALPPEACADASVRLVQAACPEFSGRSFGPHSDFDALLAEIKKGG